MSKLDVAAACLSAAAGLFMAGSTATASPVAAPAANVASDLDGQGLAAFQQRSFERAEHLFLRACKADPTNDAPQSHLAMLLIGQKHLPILVYDFKSLAATSPSVASIHYWLGQGEYRKKDYTAAEGELKTAIQLAPDRWVYHWYLSQTLRAEGREADADAERAVMDKLRKAEPHETT